MIGCRQAGRVLLHAASIANDFVLFCLSLRLVIAALRQDNALAPAALLFTIGAAAAKGKRPERLLGLAILSPLICGLGRMGLLELGSPLSVVLSGVCIAGITQSVACRFRTKQSAAPTLSKSSVPGDASIESGQAPVSTLALAFSCIVAASCLATYWGESDLWRTAAADVLKVHVPDYGAALYVLYSATLWMQGVHFFRRIVAMPIAKPFLVDTMATAVVATCTLFLALQLWLNLPEGRVLYRNPVIVVAGELPFDDSQSLGSVACACFAYFIARCLRSTDSRGTRAINALLAFSTLLVLLASWSRVAWLAAALACGFFALRAGTVRVLTFGAVFLASAAAMLNATSLMLPVLDRLLMLLKLDDQGRWVLYKRAARMISAEPVNGHGIGTFYSKSLSFAQSGRFWEDVPNFAHNFLLQIGAELGIPAMILFAFIAGRPLLRGFQASWSEVRNRTNHGFSLTAAAFAYLLTQVTANALNIYVAQQFFFWTLLALLCLGCPDSREQPAERDDQQ